MDSNYGKIVNAYEAHMAKCLAADISFTLSAGKDPHFVESLTELMKALQEAQEKRAFASMKAALKRISR